MVVTVIVIVLLSTGIFATAVSEIDGVPIGYFDTNGDGVIDVGPYKGQVIEVLDTNGDGLINELDSSNVIDFSC